MNLDFLINHPDLMIKPAPGQQSQDKHEDDHPPDGIQKRFGRPVNHGD